MSRIGQLNELRALREAITALEAEVRALKSDALVLKEKLDAMEPKRKKKDGE